MNRRIARLIDGIGGWVDTNCIRCRHRLSGPFNVSRWPAIRRSGKGQLRARMRHDVAEEESWFRAEGRFEVQSTAR